MTLSALTVRGPFRGPTGYDHHVREFVRELHRQGVRVHLIDLPEWGPVRLPRHLRDPWFETLGQPVDADVVLHFCMPHQVILFPNRANVNYTMFEATRIPPTWVMAGRQHDLVVLPTESSRRAWIASGVPQNRVRLCPLGIDADLYGTPAEPWPLQRDSGESIAEYRVRFLNVSALGPRKNLRGLLRAWLLATSAQDNAILILKIGRYAPGWLEEFRHEIQVLQVTLGKRLEQAAPVHFVTDLLSDAEMPRLYAASSHYISTSFGEGWDQPMIEAAASGLRLIAPNHSAYPAYLDASVAQLLASREVPAVFPGGGVIGDLFEDVRWWEPDEAAAIAAIRAAIAGHDADKASARERILRDFTWERATCRLLELLDDVAVRRRRPERWPGRLWSKR